MNLREMDEKQTTTKRNVYYNTCTHKRKNEMPTYQPT